MSSRISYMDLVRSTCTEECSKTLINSYKSQHDHSKNAFPWQFTHMLKYVCACSPMLSSVYIVVVSKCFSVQFGTRSYHNYRAC